MSEVSNVDYNGTKLSFRPRTLDESIVRDGLSAVASLEDYSQSKGLHFLVGGIATQTYIPTSCRRGTADIDLAVMKPLGMDDFRSFALGALNYLMDNNYIVKLEKGHNAFHLIYGKDNEASIIEFARNGQNRFERIKNRLISEYDRSRKKTVEGTDSTIRVSSPEDIAVPKIVRCINSLERNPDFSELIEDKRNVFFDVEEVIKRLEQIKLLRQEATIHVGDPRLAERLRFVSDLYDVRVLAELTGFNELELKNSMNNWDTINSKHSQRNAIFCYALPRLDLFFEQREE